MLAVYRVPRISHNPVYTVTRQSVQSQQVYIEARQACPTYTAPWGKWVCMPVLFALMTCSFPPGPGSSSRRSNLAGQVTLPPSPPAIAPASNTSQN